MIAEAAGPAKVRPVRTWLTPARVELAAVVLLSAIGLGLRLTEVSRSLFTDEAYSLALAQRSLPHMFSLFGFESNGTPYPIVLWPLIRLFGDSVVILRAPAVAAGVAGIPALWWTARRYGGRAVAVLAAGLLALSPMAVFYSQAARPYSFVVLAGTLSFGMLPRALESNRRRWWGGYVASMTVLAYAELLAAPIVLPAQAVLLARADGATRRRWLRSLAAVALLCVPLVVAAVIERGRRNPLYWLPRPDRTLVKLALQEFTVGFIDIGALRWLILLVSAALVLIAALQLRRWRAVEQRVAFAATLAWALLPGALLLVGSVVTPLFYPRFAIVALPGMCLLVALAAVAVFSSRRGAVLAVCCVAALGVAAVVADVHQRNALQEDWRRAAVWLRERPPGVPLVVDNAQVLPALGYYDPALASADGDLIVQEWRDRRLPPAFVGFRDPTGYGSSPAGQPTVAAVRAAARRGSGSVWMVFGEIDYALQGDPRAGPAVAWLRSHCQVTVRESVAVGVLRANGCLGA
jgi:4-amino-4-deoxy-L-arabinose transferase-like glycosyltransferase